MGPIAVKTQRILLLFIILINISFANYRSKDYTLYAYTRLVYTKGTKTYLVANVRLTNNTADTLRYLSWSCSYWEFYMVKSKRLTGFDKICLRNLPCLKVLPPHRSDSVSLTYTVIAARSADPIKYKIGMEIAKDEGDNGKNQLLHRPMKYTIIWADEVKYP